MSYSDPPEHWDHAIYSVMTDSRYVLVYVLSLYQYIYTNARICYLYRDRDRASAHDHAGAFLIMIHAYVRIHRYILVDPLMTCPVRMHDHDHDGECVACQCSCRDVGLLETQYNQDIDRFGAKNHQKCRHLQVGCGTTLQTPGLLVR